MARRSMVEEKRFREVMGHFPTGVTVVTIRGEGGAPFGLTVSAFTSVSLQPLLVLVCVHRDATAHDLFVEGVSFAVNILSSHQADLAVRFASGVSEERFTGLEVEDSPLGNPLLPGSLAWLECRVKDSYPGGDHTVLVGEVVDYRAREGDPLLFHRGSLRGMES